MTRASELFAVAALVLFALGLALRRAPVVSGVYIDVHRRGIAYALPPEAGAFALAALFGVFAFVYSLWMLRMNHTAAALHFWLSAVGTVLFGIGMVATANIAKAAALPERGDSNTAVVSTFVGVAVLFIAQVVFLANLFFTIVRTTRTP
jgi:hypothetical protein